MRCKNSHDDSSEPLWEFNFSQRFQPSWEWRQIALRTCQLSFSWRFVTAVRINSHGSYFWTVVKIVIFKVFFQLLEESVNRPSRPILDETEQESLWQCLPKWQCPRPIRFTELASELAGGTVTLQILHVFMEQILPTLKKHKNLENNKARKEEGIELK